MGRLSDPPPSLARSVTSRFQVDLAGGVSAGVWKKTGHDLPSMPRISAFFIHPTSRSFGRDPVQRLGSWVTVFEVQHHCTEGITWGFWRGLFDQPAPFSDV